MSQEISLNSSISYLETFPINPTPVKGDSPLQGPMLAGLAGAGVALYADSKKPFLPIQNLKTRISSISSLPVKARIAIGALALISLNIFYHESLKKTSNTMQIAIKAAISTSKDLYNASAKKAKTSIEKYKNLWSTNPISMIVVHTLAIAILVTSYMHLKKTYNTTLQTAGKAEPNPSINAEDKTSHERKTVVQITTENLSYIGKKVKNVLSGLKEIVMNRFESNSGNFYTGPSYPSWLESTDDEDPQDSKKKS